MARPVYPWTLWTTLGRTTAEMMTASSEVIANRTTRMAKASSPPSLQDQREFNRMVAEKVEASQESAQAVAASYLTTQTRLAAKVYSNAFGIMPMMMAVATSRTAAEAFNAQMKLASAIIKPVMTHDHASDALETAHEAMKPYHARARANAKRLRGIKSRA